MNASKLFPEINNLNRLDDIEVKSLEIDSREVKKGSVFFAYKGNSLDGNDYIEDAIANGASVVLSDSSLVKEKENIFYVEDLKKKIGIYSSRFYGHPSSKLKTICVTGTNGKTTTVETLANLGTLLKENCSFMSTINFSINDKIKEESDLTTPDPITINKNISEALSQRAEYIAMEASSHGLTQGRLTGIDIDYAILTSFSQDHLDYHKDLESYKLAKRSLFFDLRPKNNLICIDSSFGKEIYSELKNINPNTYSISIKEEADIKADFEVKKNKLKVNVNALGNKMSFELNTISRYLASNFICSLAVFLLEGKDPKILSKVCSKIQFPFGRLEKVSERNPIVYIDYAHTPEALEYALEEIRNMHKGELWCLFGCGGERDASKRPIMGKVAEDFSDFIILTSDNPRNENETKIIEEIKSGILNQKKIKIETNRKQAIYQTLIELKDSPESVLLIAGKGHESYQEIKGKQYEFNDKDMIRSVMSTI